MPDDKIIRIAISFFLFVQSFSGYALDNAASAKSRETDTTSLISIPSSLGFIRQTSGLSGISPKALPDKLIIHLQDAHCHFEAQKNSAKILKKILGQIKTPSLIEVEGNAGRLDVSLLSTFPDLTLRREIAEALLKMGHIGASEFLAVMQPDDINNVYGPEDLSLYFTHLNYFRQNLKERDAILGILDLISQKLKEIERVRETKELKELRIASENFSSGRSSLDQYAAFLIQEAGRMKVTLDLESNMLRFQQADIMSKKIDFPSIQKEHQSLIESVSKKTDHDSLAEILSKTMYYRLEKITPFVYFSWLKEYVQSKGMDFALYPNLNSYLDYLSYFEKIDKEKLFEEMENVHRLIRHELALPAQLAALFENLDFVEILKKFHLLEISREEYSVYQEKKNTLTVSEILDFIQKYSDIVSPVKLNEKDVQILRSSTQNSEKFYETAERRDKVLVENTLKQMDAENVNVGVLVAGGYHTSGILKKLKEKNIPYIVIAPRIADVRAKTPYLEMMGNQRSPMEASLEKEISSQENKQEFSENPKTMNLAVMSSLQDAAVLNAFSLEPGLTPAIRRIVLDLMKSMSVRNILTAAYAEILVAIQGLKHGKQEDMREIKARAQGIFSKWAGIYAAHAQSLGIAGEELAAVTEAFAKIQKGIDVYEVEKIGNRLFLTLQIFGEYRGLIMDPGMKEQNILSVLNGFELLEIEDMVLLKKAQTVMQNILGREKKATWRQLVKALPDLSHLTPLLKRAPFPLIEVENGFEMGVITAEEGMGLRDSMNDSNLPAAKRIDAAADLLRAIEENKDFEPLRAEVNLFVFNLKRRALLVEEVFGPHFHLNPASINPLKNLYSALPEGGVERAIIEKIIRFIQMGFIRLDNQALAFPTDNRPFRLEEVYKKVKQILTAAHAGSKTMLLLNDHYYALDMNLFRNASAYAARILVEEDFELSVSQELSRRMKSKFEEEVIGSSALLESYLFAHETLGHVLLDKSGNLLWSSVSPESESAMPAALTSLKEAFLRQYGAIYGREGEHKLAGTEWSFQKVALTLPAVENELKGNKKFSVQERDALDVPKIPAGIRIHLKRAGPPAEIKQILPEIQKIGTQTPDGGVFVYALDGDAQSYLVFQRVGNALKLIDASNLAKFPGGGAQFPRHIVIPEISQAVSSAGTVVALTALGNPAADIIAKSSPLKEVFRVIFNKLSFLAKPFSSVLSLWTSFKLNLLSYFTTKEGVSRWRLSPALISAVAAVIITLGIAGKAVAQTPPTTETPPATVALEPIVTNPELPPLVPRFGLLGLRPDEPPSRYTEVSASVIFNQAVDYRFRLDSRFSRSWTFNALWVRSGLMNDTMEPRALQLIETNAALLGLGTGYIGPFEFARANRLLPVGSNLGRIQFLYEQPGGPFWMDFNLGMSYFDVPQLRGDRYTMRADDFSPFGGINLGLRGRFDRPWVSFRDEAELGIHYQEVLRDRLLNPEGVGSTHLTNRMWADFRLWDGRLVLTPLLETGADIQPLINAYIEGAMSPDGLTNDGVARRIIIPWGTRRAGITAFPFDDRGGPPNYDLSPSDLLGALDFYNHVGIQFRLPPAIWQRLEGRVRFQPWNFLEFRLDGGVDLTWRPQVDFMLRDVPENLHSDYLKDHWELGFYAIPFIRPGISAVLFRDLRGDVDFEGRWVSDLPLSARVTARLRWEPRWIPGTELDIFYRYSNYSDPFGTVQNYSESPWHSFGLTLKVRHSPIGANGKDSKTVASVTQNDDGTVDVASIDGEKGSPKSNWLRRLYENAKMRLIEPWIEKTLDKFKQRYPKVNLKKFKLFLTNSQRLGSIIHSDDSDQEIHLHQNLFHPWRFIWSKVFSLFGGGKDLEKWSELAVFTLAHEAIRHPQVDIDHSDFLRYANGISPKLMRYYERCNPEVQERLREFIEELVVIYGDIGDDFLKSSGERQQAILDALEEAEPKNAEGLQAYRDLLSRSRTMKPADIHQQIFNFLMKDTRFAASLTPDLYSGFIKFGQFLSQKWVLTGPGLKAAKDKTGAAEGMTRREMTVASLKALGALGVAMLLKACGVPDETWNLERHEIVTVEEDTGTDAISVVDGATVSVQPNSVLARLTVDSDPGHRRGALQPYVLTTTPSNEPDPRHRNVQIFIHLAVSAERGDILFPESGNLNQYSNFDVEMVTNGIPFTLIFVDNNGSYYEIPIHIPNADPEKMYRITIQNLLQALDINGLVPAETDVFVSMPATTYPFTFLIFTGAAPTAPVLTGKTGELKKEVGRGYVEGENFVFLDSKGVEADKARTYQAKINAALDILKRFERLPASRVPLHLTEDSNHFLDFAGHIGIDTDFFEKNYPPELLALLLDHEFAHVKGGTERDAVLSNSDLYDLMKSRLGDFLPDALKAQHPYLAFLDRLSGLSGENKVLAADEFVRDFPELFSTSPRSKLNEAAEIVSRVWGKDELRKKWEIREDFISALKEKLAQERYAENLGLFSSDIDRRLLEILEVLIQKENLNLKDLTDLADQLIQTGRGERVLSAETLSMGRLDLAVLLGQFYAYARGAYLSDHFLRTVLSSEDFSETGSKYLSDVMSEAAESEDETVREQSSMIRALQLTSDGGILVNNAPLENISAGLKSEISGFIKRYGHEGQGLTLDFGEMPFSQTRLKLLLASIFNNADRLDQNLTFRDFPDGSVVKSSLEGNILKLKVVSQRQRWAGIYNRTKENQWARIADHMKAPDAQTPPPVKMIVLGSDSLAAQAVREKDQWTINLDSSRFSELYAQTRNIPHPLIQGSAVKWVIPVVVEGKISDQEKIDIEKNFLSVLLASHPEWKEEAGQNIMIRVIQEGEEDSGEKMIARAEEKFLKGDIKLDRAKDLMLILSEREKEKLTLKDVLPWVIQGTLDEKKLMLIAELLAADGDQNKLSKEIVGLIKEIDPETLTDLNNRQLLDARPLTEQLQLQQQTRKLLESMA